MTPISLASTHNHTHRIVLLAISLLLLSSCQTVAVGTPTSTPAATSTSVPPSATPTNTPLSAPTFTPTASETPVSLPTETPTEKPTPAASDLLGIWERISNEHGNEYLFFGENGELIYAEGNVSNIENNPSVKGIFLFENGIFALNTEDCPSIAGAYTIRLIANEHLRFELIEDGCEGRQDGLTFQPWQRYSESE